MHQSNYRPRDASLICEWPDHTDSTNWCRLEAQWQWDGKTLREGPDAFALCQNHYDGLEGSMPNEVTPSKDDYIVTKSSSCSCEWPSHSAFSTVISSCCRQRATHQIPGSNPHLEKKAPGDDRPCYICQEHYDVLAGESISLDNIPTSLSDYLAQIEEEAEV